MKKKISRILLVLIASSSVVGTKNFAQNAAATRIAPATRFTVVPKVSLPIAMKTIPQAACTLHPEDIHDSEQSLKLFADDEGTVRFHVNPAEASDQIIRFSVDCIVDGQLTVFPLELRPNSTPGPDMPAPPADIAKPRPGGFIRPALSEEEALHLRPEELLQRHYPIRPDPVRGPDALARWLKAVTKRSRLVSSRLVARPEITHSAATSYNWSGFALTSPGQFGAVTGDWSVPAVGYEFGRTYSALWVGLDGMGTADLVQAGTEQDAAQIFGNCCPAPLIRISTYYAWTQFLPQQASEAVIPNFTVNPGDEIITQVSMHNDCRDSSGIPLPCFPVTNCKYAIFNVENVTRSEFAVIQIPRAATTEVRGYTAEWIMERPTINGTLPDLANYGIAYVNDAYAWVVPSLSWINYAGADNKQISMYQPSCSKTTGILGFICKRGDLLSEPFPVTSTQFELVWRNYK